MHSRVSQQRQPQKRRYSISAIVLTVIVVYVCAVAWWPLAAIAATTVPMQAQAGVTPTLAWPSYGQSALYGEGYGMLGTNGSEATIPIASITKIVTALTVLQAKPITDSTKSPEITFTQADVERYAHYLTQQGVVAPVTPGDTISQYDLMQIMLIASANNYAESLAVWAFGSVENYLAAAKKFLAANGLTHTTIGDPAGFSNDSASTASDLVKLGALALKNPVIAGIVAKPSVTVPDVGTFYTTNLLVSQGKAIGVKTGNTDAAGQCLLFAQKYTIDGTPITLIGAILGGTSRSQVAQDASELLTSAEQGFVTQQFASPNQAFAVYRAPWGASTTLASPSQADALIWSGDTQKIRVSAPPIHAGQQTVAGAKVTLSAGKTRAETTLKLSKPLEKPSLIWRLTHPLAVLTI